MAVGLAQVTRNELDRLRDLVSPGEVLAARVVAGAGAGALSGSLMDYGVNDEFVKKLAETIPNNSSALFVLVREVTVDKVTAEIKAWNPRVLNTSMTTEQEARLVEALKAWEGALVVVSHDRAFLDLLGLTREVEITR